MRTESWSAQLLPTLTPHVKGAPHAASPLFPDEANFFQLLYALHRLEQRQTDLAAAIHEACDKLSLHGDKEQLVVESLLASHAKATEMRLFDDPTNLLRLEQGQAAHIFLKGWEGEPVGVGQIIPGTLLPEAANLLPNLVLQPAVVRDAMEGGLTPEGVELGKRLSRTGFISRESQILLNELGKSPR